MKRATLDRGAAAIVPQVREPRQDQPRGVGIDQSEREARRMSEVDILPEVARWRARAVRYYAGFWKDLAQIVPKFQLADFVAGPDEPANPFLQTVIRLPVTLWERATPAGRLEKN